MYEKNEIGEMLNVYSLWPDAAKSERNLMKLIIPISNLVSENLKIRISCDSHVTCHTSFLYKAHNCVLSSSNILNHAALHHHQRLSFHHHRWSRRLWPNEQHGQSSLADRTWHAPGRASATRRRADLSTWANGTGRGAQHCTTSIS